MMTDVKLDLVARAELLRLFGVSGTRLVQLTSQDGFPAPVAELGAGKIWLLADVQRWADERGRVLHPLGDGS